MRRQFAAVAFHCAMKILILIIIHISTFAVGAAFAEGNPPGFAQKIEMMASSEQRMTSLERRDRLVRLYRTEFPAPLSTTDSHALSARLDAAISTVFYSKDPGVARELAMVYRALTALGGAREGDLDEVISSMIKAREFEWADTLLAEAGRPSLPSVDFGTLVGKWGGHRVMVIDNNHISVQPAEEARLRNGIVVVSSPLCGFSNAAGTFISMDSLLADGFKDALWLVPPEGDLRVREVESWNRRHPSQRMVLTYDWLDWPQIDDWSTPGFYFFADGVVVEKVMGWPLDGSRATRLRGAVEKWRKAKELQSGPTPEGF